jgi:DNA-binding transcriptional ArsR family regulator
MRFVLVHRKTFAADRFTIRQMTKYSVSVREFMTITKALADANRVRVLLALNGGELCVCQIVELFGLSPSTVSKHLSILQHAGLIVSRKTERWVYYRLPARDAVVAVREAIDWVQKSLGGTPQAVADRKKLKQILKLDPRMICRRQLQR